MTFGYITWALIGMVGYSLTTISMKQSAAHGFSAFMVLAIAVTTVCTCTWITVAVRGEIKPIFANLATPAAAWALTCGIVLYIAVSSLFRALALGPASAVVPIYGMFIVFAPLLGILFLHEAVTGTKIAGIAAAVLGVYLISL